jgi:LPXTG-motif cell wall-anchored protein
MKTGHISLLAAAGLICASTLFISRAKAGEWDRLSTVTFNQPFEIPGMVLPPGTYTMKLLDTPFRGPDFVVFSDKTDQHTYKIVQAIPVYRDEPADHTIITFEERAGGSPQAVKDWWYPGFLLGEELVYPKAHSVLTASAAPLPAPAPAPAPPPPAQAKAAPAPAPPPAPAQAPVETAQAQPAPAAPTPPPAENTQPKQLPKTGSDLPLVGLLGMLSAGAGLGLRKFA